MLRSAPTTEGRKPRGAAPRVPFSGFRLVRDTAAAQSVKRQYDFRCQVCGTQVPTIGGRYAEAAHIVPLGGGYDGPDDEENILCLCPNHHAAFDHGGIYVLDSLEVRDVNGAPLGELTVASDHPLNAEHLAAHRRRFGY